MTLDVHVRREAERAGRSPAELAYQFAIERDGQNPPYNDISFPWQCQSCDRLVIDRGAFGSPAVFRGRNREPGLVMRSG